MCVWVSTLDGSTGDVSNWLGQKNDPWGQLQGSRWTRKELERLTDRNFRTQVTHHEVIVNVILRPCPSCFCHFSDILCPFVLDLYAKSCHHFFSPYRLYDLYRFVCHPSCVSYWSWLTVNMALHWLLVEEQLTTVCANSRNASNSCSLDKSSIGFPW